MERLGTLLIHKRTIAKDPSLVVRKNVMTTVLCENRDRSLRFIDEVESIPELDARPIHKLDA